jgi:hypothetical protein
VRTIDVARALTDSLAIAARGTCVTSFSLNPLGGVYLHCAKCGPVEVPDFFLGATSPRAVTEALAAMIREHEHTPPPAPRPLTRRQRELALTRMRHRRGAWKL